MILVGIHGPIQHGKSSLAEAMLICEPEAEHDASSRLISDFANAAKSTMPLTNSLDELNSWLSELPPLINEILGAEVTPEQLLITQKQIDEKPEDFQQLWKYIELLEGHEHVRGQEIDEQNKAFHRPILQWFGNFFVTRIRPTIWYDRLVDEAKESAEGGCELYAISGLRYPTDAAVVRRAGGFIIEIIRPSHEITGEADPTEIQRQLIETDTKVINDGDLAQLERTAEQLLADYKAGKLAEEYVASKVG